MTREEYDTEFQYKGMFYKKDGMLFRAYLDIQRKKTALTKPDLMVIMMNPGSSRPKNEDKNSEQGSSIQITFEAIHQELMKKENIDHSFFKKYEVKAKADNTQYQIMAVMNKVKKANGEPRFHYARILNLSDYCDSKSGSFIKKINKLNTIKYFKHSIFDRDKELEILFEPNVPVILGWGLNEKLSALSTKAMQFFEKIQLNNTVEKIKTYPALKDKLSYDDVEIIKAILKEEKNKNIFKLPENYYPTRHPYPRGNQDRQKKWLDDMVALLNERLCK